MEKRVTIILPTYNAENTIKETIESVLNQTYKNIELIVIDDGSIDRTVDICLEYKENSRVKLICKENTGVSNTRNIALEKASGTYIMFIDSDDIYCNNYVEEMINSIEKNKTELVICGYKRVNKQKNKEVNKQIKNKIYNKSEFDKLIIATQNNNLFNQIWNKIFIKEIIDLNKIKFNEELSLGEDFRFVMQYIEFVNNISVLEKNLYIYINSIEGLNVKYRKDRLYLNISNIEILEKYFRKNNFNLDYIKRKYVITILSGIKNICLNPNKKEINEELKKLKSNQFIMEKLSEKKEFKYNIISNIVKHSNVYLLRIYGKILIMYEKLYKKIKLGY